jgi:hypothetical protein
MHQQQQSAVQAGKFNSAVREVMHFGSSISWEIGVAVLKW